MIFRVSLSRLLISVFVVGSILAMASTAKAASPYPNPISFGFDAYSSSDGRLFIETNVQPATPMGMPDTTVSISSCQGWGDVFRMTGRANRHLDPRRESLTSNAFGKAELLVWHIKAIDFLDPLGLKFTMAPRNIGKGGPATCLHIDVRVEGSQEHISYDRVIDLGS